MPKISRPPKNTIIKRSKISGMGSFAAKNFNSGEQIKFLEGKKLRGLEVDKLILSGKINFESDIQIGRDLFFIPTGDSYYINHSCSPNSAIRGDNELFAIVDIFSGEEITIDYSTTVGTNNEPDWLTNSSDWYMDCKCGSKFCRGKIGSVETLPKKTLISYLKSGGFPEFIKTSLNNA